MIDNNRWNWREIYLLDLARIFDEDPVDILYFLDWSESELNLVVHKKTNSLQFETLLY